MARAKVLRNRILSIAVSLALAFFLWLALAGQDTSTTEISVPLELTNLPSDLTIKTDLPTAVNFQVLANAAQLRFLTDRKLQIWIDASSAREGYNAFPVDPDALELPRGVQVRKVSPQVLEFEAVRTSDKVVPLRATVTGAVSQGFRVQALTLSPDEVTLRGPQELLKAIDELPTTPIALEGLTRDTQLVVTPSLADLDPSLMVDPREIRVSVKVEEQRVEATFPDLPIGLDLKNGGLGLSPILQPDRATISVAWPASRGRPVTAAEIRVRVFVDEERLRKEGTLTLPVVAVAPNGTTITGITPVNVVIRLNPEGRPTPAPASPVVPAPASPVAPAPASPVVPAPGEAPPKL